MSLHVAATARIALCGSSMDGLGLDGATLTDWQRAVCHNGAAPCARCAQHVLRHPALSQYFSRKERGQLIAYLKFRDAEP